MIMKSGFILRLSDLQFDKVICFKKKRLTLLNSGKLHGNCLANEM